MTQPNKDPGPIESEFTLSSRQTTSALPPVYCTRDRMVLEDDRAELHMGYDPFTGIERPKHVVITRRCPTEGHDVWSLQGSLWIKV